MCERGQRRRDVVRSLTHVLVFRDLILYLLSPSPSSAHSVVWRTCTRSPHKQTKIRTQLKLETLDDAVVLEDPDDDLLGEKHGCPVYASPEILSTVNGRYSGRGADCWSLGVILYTMLVGRYPFHDTNPTHLFGKIRRGLFQIPTSISPLARVVINSLLRKDPMDRMTTEDLLASQLFSAKFMQQQQQQQSLHPDCTTVTSSSRPSLASLLSRSGSGNPSSSPSSILIHSPLFSLTSSSTSSSSDAFSLQNV